MPRALLLLPLLWLLAACSPQATAGPDDAATTDLTLAETLADAEVDGTDSLEDVVDVADVIDADADVPYWVAHDIDISGLGVITQEGFCSDVYLKVKPNDPPHEPSCTSACPAPYPCTCGTCPWIETPPMNVPRVAAEAIWTGEEVLVFGGWYTLGAPNVFTAERWNPSLNKGFEMIDLPFTVTSNEGQGAFVKAFWTGTEAVVVMDDHEFRFDPKTNIVTEMPIAPIYKTPHGAIVRAGEMLFWWGADLATKNDVKHPAHIAGWRADTGWQDLPFPSAFLQSSWGEEPYCITVLEGQIYVFDPRNPRTPNSGLDPDLPVMLKFDPLTKTWTALPQTMVPGIRCLPLSTLPPILFQSFPDGIAVIPVSPTAVGSPPHVGEIWWKATGQWTAMQPPPIVGLDRRLGVWTGSQFVIAEVYFQDPVTMDKLLPDPSGWDVPTWPVRYDPYTDKFGYLTSIGYPKHYRIGSAHVFTGTELITLGGANGISAMTVHKDGVRLSFPKP